jgi:hypothetical protein
MMVTSVHHKINPKKKPWSSVFIFWRIFATWRKKKRGLANPTKGFLRFKKKNQSPYLDQKILEVARFRQCVPVSRQK